ncbi:hypothetical protein G3M81_22910 [Bacillus paralicheniformis]|uniref:hypothetical protein n=1 Tax=Bacillus TaxID=1386 RepID=UPI0013EE93C9|nr:MULTISPECIES: hypothetical protein [Bacillus]QII26942.1 hypothetical protein G3M80_20820 [Bacillus altitudinis]QII51410.1 hypothetical protein G3M81_22910 [Bacillus paralicheniformis]
MARMTQYEKGYLQGEIDSAKVELENLDRILHEMKRMGNIPENAHINIVIRDVENFLKEHGELEDVEYYDEDDEE